MNKYKTPRAAVDGHDAEFWRWSNIYFVLLIVGAVPAFALGAITHSPWTVLFVASAVFAFGMMTRHMLGAERAFRALYPKTPQVPLSQR